MNLQEKIKNLAYELYEKNGRREGRDLLDWLAAEQIIRFRQMIFSGMSGDAVGLLEYKPSTGTVVELPTPAKQLDHSRKPSGGRRPAVAERAL